MVLPVIHVQDEAQARRNADIAIEEGAQGVFFINHDFPKEKLIPMLGTLRAQNPSGWIGVNFLAVPGEIAFPILGDLAREGVVLDAYWADDARIDERRDEDDQPEADVGNARRAESGWKGLYFGGTAFKKQRPVPAEGLAASARIARRYMDVVTTSGAATGIAADVSKIEMLRAAVGDAPLALASGVTVDNAAVYAPFVDAFLVATGINHTGDFYNIDPARLRHLVSAC
ncbi:BtpA/SgcQ family protein [Mesorhizobium sp. B2-6-5]|uniref:BtpA/SgcQ family protein n=1 Tax=Mesorhizobium sp. B2-6-5 TaxID=2589912 RepID=UPI001AED5991|nr:BtpA/SgcQ family protein [Mesorhizobium sp. B2-6-5]